MHFINLLVGLAFGGFIFYLGVLMFKKGHQILKETAKYEFENTDDGGVVRFNNFEDSVKHQRSINKANLYRKYCLLPMTIGIIIIIFVLK